MCVYMCVLCIYFIHLLCRLYINTNITSYLNIFMRELALLARYVDTYEEFVNVSETTNCNGMTFNI